MLADEELNVTQNFRLVFHEVENIVVTRLFSFSHNVFRSLFPTGSSKVSLYGKGLAIYTHSRLLTTPKEEGFGKHLGKRRKCW